VPHIPDRRMGSPAAGASNLFHQSLMLTVNAIEIINAPAVITI